MLQNFAVLLVTDTEILRNNTDIYGFFFTNFVKKSLRYALFSNFIIEKRRVTQRATANIIFCNSPFGAKKIGCKLLFLHLFFTREGSNLFYANRNNREKLHVDILP